MTVAKGTRLKQQGQERAERSKAEILTLARGLAIEAAMQRPNRLATIDDVMYLLRKRYNIWPDKLGMAAGSVFKGAQWSFVKTIPSKRISSHARPVSVWRLKT